MAQNETFIPFSNIISKMNSTKKKYLVSFFGKWPGQKEELNKITKELENERRSFRTREIKINPKRF